MLLFATARGTHFKDPKIELKHLHKFPEKAQNIFIYFQGYVNNEDIALTDTALMNKAPNDRDGYDVAEETQDRRTTYSIRVQMTIW